MTCARIDKEQLRAGLLKASATRPIVRGNYNLIAKFLIYVANCYTVKYL